MVDLIYQPAALPYLYSPSEFCHLINFACNSCSMIHERYQSPFCFYCFPHVTCFLLNLMRALPGGKSHVFFKTIFTSVTLLSFLSSLTFEHPHCFSHSGPQGLLTIQSFKNKNIPKFRLDVANVLILPAVLLTPSAGQPRSLQRSYIHFFCSNWAKSFYIFCWWSDILHVHMWIILRFNSFPCAILMTHV